MSQTNCNQADGFFDEEPTGPRCHHKECFGLSECSYALGPNENSGKGRVQMPDKDVWQLTHGAINFRLVKGFNLLKRSER